MELIIELRHKTENGISMSYKKVIMDSDISKFITFLAKINPMENPNIFSYDMHNLGENLINAYHILDSMRDR